MNDDWRVQVDFVADGRADALHDRLDAEELEHAVRVARERQESEESGYPEYEVRVDLPSHGEAKNLVERLDAEGLRVAWPDKFPFKTRISR